MLDIHTSVARDVATNPAHDGGFDPARYAVALMAVALVKNTAAMAALSDCGGECGKVSCHTSEQKQTDLQILRDAMDDLAGLYDVSIAGLQLPADPVTDTRYTDMKNASDVLKQVLTEFACIPGVLPALSRQVEILKARKQPAGLLGIFKNCAACVGGGAGGAAVSHIGCIAVPALAAASGSVVSAGTMAGIMMVTAPIIAAGVTAAVDKWRGAKLSVVKIAGSAGLAFAIAAGMAAMGGHEGHGGDHHDHHHPAPAPATDHHHQHHQHH